MIPSNSDFISELRRMASKSPANPHAARVATAYSAVAEPASDAHLRAFMTHATLRECQDRAGGAPEGISDDPGDDLRFIAFISLIETSPE